MAYMQKHYNAAGTVVCVAGKFDEKEIIKKVKSSLARSSYSISEQWYEGKNNEYWGARWEFTAFNLNEVTKLMIFTHKILNSVENEWKLIIT